MEYPNENMEEFFRNSLDKFDDKPSDAVWSSLDQRLEEDKPNSFVKKWFKYIFPISLLLLGGSILFWHQNGVIKDYKNELITIKDKNSALKNEINQIKSSNIQHQSQENEIVATIEEKEKYTTEVKTSFLTRIDTVYIVKYLPSETQNTWSYAQGKNTLNASTSIYNNQLDQFPDKLSYSKASPTGQNTRIILETPNTLSWGSHKKSGLLYSLNSSGSLIPEVKLARIISSKENRKKKEIKGGPIIVVQDDIWGRPDFYYKAGFSMNLLSSLIGDYFSASSTGFGYGLTQEIGLSTRVAITSGAKFTHQEYTLSNNGLPLEMSQVNSFPRQDNYPNRIVKAEVENKFIEIPLGLKYDFYRDSNKTFFLNPAVKFSLHKPQQFSYFLSENRFEIFSTDNRFAYLNAINLAVGVEKNINPFMCYQVSLGYDYSLEPIGIEHQTINSLYLRANLLFGKK